MADSTSTAAEKALTPAQSASRQVEFYLSDSNLPFDKFLFGLWASSFHTPETAVLAAAVPKDAPEQPVKPAKDSKFEAYHLGWLPLERLTSFKRMRPYLDSAEQDGLGSVEGVAQAIKDNSTLVEVAKLGDESADAPADKQPQWFVRRRFVLRQPEDAMQRSAYIKGFPVPKEDLAPTADGGAEGDEKKKEAGEVDSQAVKEAEDALQVKLEQFVASLNVGDVKAVRMRRENLEVRGKTIRNRGAFKGSIFIEFGSSEDVKKLLEIEPKPKFEDRELVYKSKEDYVEEKRKLYGVQDKDWKGGNKGGSKFGPKQFNAWADSLVDKDGFPTTPAAAAPRERGFDRKRKAENDFDERDVIYDGVTFTARKHKRDGTISVVDEETVGKREGAKYTFGKLLFCDIDGEKSADPDAAETGSFEYPVFKEKLAPLAKVGYVELVKSGASGDDKGPLFPARVRVSFKEPLTDEKLEELKSTTLPAWQGYPATWSRASEDDEFSHFVSRVKYHSQQAFAPKRGAPGGGGGYGGRGGHANKRQRR